MPEPILIDLNINDRELSELINQRLSIKPIKPELIEPNQIRRLAAYKRFLDLEKKELFRKNLLQKLTLSWIEIYDEDTASLLVKNFAKLAHELDENGALICAEMINKRHFTSLIQCYDEILSIAGNKNITHSYVNLGNYPHFINNNEFKDAFLHPLFIALITYRMGGAIRVVDVRAKDAEPISVLARDNILHIDNTPFNEEYKIILAWEKSKVSGPKGQNFVFIPGTQKSVRNCFVSADGIAWSTENAGIFTTENDIQQVFKFQEKVWEQKYPTVIEVNYPDKPVTTVFAAGSLIHHRYRTEVGSSRSCVILAFHRAADNPGQFFTTHPATDSSTEEKLDNFLFGKNQSNNEIEFIKALCLNAEKIASKINALRLDNSATKLLKLNQLTLSEEALKYWKKIITQSPTIETLKRQAHFFPLEQTISYNSFIEMLGKKLMAFDKEGHLDLILYENNSEEIRKWARNRIREMKVSHIIERLEHWKTSIKQPVFEHLLIPKKLHEIAKQMVDFIDNCDIPKEWPNGLDKSENITLLIAYKSVRQLINDLGEAIMRCESRSIFLITSLFLFFSCDLLCTLQDKFPARLQELGELLLSNYISTSILIEKKIKQENLLQTNTKQIVKYYNPHLHYLNFFSNFKNNSYSESIKFEYNRQWKLDM